MSFRERKLSFREVDRLYAELERQHEAGSISDEEFDTQRRQLMVQDDEGRWWAKGHTAGQWRYRAESGWVRGISPGYQPPPTDDASDHCCSSSRPSRFPRGVRYAMRARSYRTSNRMKKAQRKRSRAGHQQAIGTCDGTGLLIPTPEGEEREALYGHRK